MNFFGIFQFFTFVRLRSIFTDNLRRRGLLNLHWNIAGLICNSNKLTVFSNFTRDFKQIATATSSTAVGSKKAPK